jgi:AcrR family transcriptional regulator
MNIHYPYETQMTRPDPTDQIKAAVVQIATSKGMGAANMADIAKLAKVSPGTLYLRFKNKEDMLQKTYLAIKTDFHATLMQAAKAGNSTAILNAMWMQLFGFLQTRPLDFLFLEYAGAAQILTPDQKAQTAPLQAEIDALIQTAIDDGTLRQMPLGVAINLLIGPAMQLARRAAMAGQPATAAEIDLTFTTIWAAIRA